MANVVAFRRGARRTGAAGTSPPCSREPAANAPGNSRWALRAACAALAAILAAARLPAVIVLRATELLMLVVAGGTVVGWLLTQTMRWDALAGSIAVFLIALTLRQGGNALLKLCQSVQIQHATHRDEKNPDG